METSNYSIHQFLQHTLSNSQLDAAIKEFRDKSASDPTIDISDEVIASLKGVFNKQSAIRFIKLLEIFPHFDKSKLISLVTKALIFIDGHCRVGHLLYACKSVSYFLSVSDLTANSPMPMLIAASFIKDLTSEDLNRLAQLYGDALIKLTSTKNPSVYLSKRIGERIGRELFLSHVLLKTERFVLRSSALAISVLQVCMPEMNLPATEKSVVNACISAILASNKDTRKNLIKAFERFAHVYASCSLVSLINRSFSNASNLQNKTIVGQLLEYVNLKEATPDTLVLVLSFFTNSISEVKIAALKAASTNSLLIPHILELQIDSETAPYAFEALMSMTPEQAEGVKKYVQTHFSLCPAVASKVLLMNKLAELTPEQINALSEQSKFAAARIEALVRVSKIELAAQIYESTPVKLSPFAINQLARHMVWNPAVSEHTINFLAMEISKNPRKYDRDVAALFSQRAQCPQNVPELLNLVHIRPVFAARILARYGFSEEVSAFVSKSLAKYDPEVVPQEDIELIQFEGAIDIRHSSATSLREMKQELSSPTATTDLPKLKKMIEKTTSKVEIAQKAIRESIMERIVRPVTEALTILNESFKCFKIQPQPLAASYSTNLVKLQKVFGAPAHDALKSAIMRVDSFQTIPSIVLSVLLSTPEPEPYPMSLLIHSKPSAFSLNLLKPVLQQLLEQPDSDKLCDINAAKGADIAFMLPLFLDRSAHSEKAGEFARALAEGQPIEALEAAKERLLDSNEDIRANAFACFAVAKNLEALDANLYARLAINCVNHEERIDVIENVTAPEETLEILRGFLELDTKDDELQIAIGITFANFSPDVDKAFSYLASQYHEHMQSKETYQVQTNANIRLSIAAAIRTLEPTSIEAIDFVTVTGLTDLADLPRSFFSELCEYYIENFTSSQRANLMDRFLEFLNVPAINVPHNNRLRLALFPLCLKIVEKEPSLSVLFLNSIFKYSIFSTDQEVRKASMDAASLLLKLNRSEIEPRSEALMSTLDSVKTTEQIYGFAATYAALLHSQGFSALKKENVFQFTDSLAKSSTETQRLLACQIYGCLSSQFVAMLEPSLPSILPSLLVLFGDSKESVRDAAEVAFSSIVSNLTRACSERVIPSALAQLETEGNWRVQRAATLLIKSVITVSTRSVSKFMPSLTRVLSKGLKSSSSELRAASKDVLSLLKSSVTNEAVRDLFDDLSNALIDTSCLDEAISKISHINLHTPLDSASLSLIAPIIVLGSSSHKQNVRQQSLRIIGTLPAISNQDSIESFADELLEPLLSAITDASPTTRTIASSSLQTITVSLPRSTFDRVLQKLLDDMPYRQTFAERQGNAQAIASLIKGLGVDALMERLAAFVEEAKHNSVPAVREGYISLLGFLSHFFGEEFESAYDLSIGAVLSAAADPSDSIRTVGLRSASLIARAFAKSRPQLILKPYFACSMDENWRMRLCAVSFIKSFVLAVAETTEAEDKGYRQIGEMLGKLQSALPADVLVPALLTLFILSNDPVKSVSDDAMTVWRQTVPNTGEFLRAYSSGLLDRLSAFVSAKCEVVRQVGASAMAASVNRLKGNFLKACIETLDTLLTRGIDTQHGALLCIHAVVEYMTSEEKLAACAKVAPFLGSPSPMVREEALAAFIEARDSLGEDGSRVVSRELVMYVMNKAESGEDIQTLGGLLGILGNHAILDLTHKVLQRPLLINRVRVAGEVTAAAGKSLDPVIPSFTDRILQLVATPQSAEEGEIAKQIAESVVGRASPDQLKAMTVRLVDAMRSQQPQNRKAGIYIAAAVMRRVCVSLNPTAEQLLRAAIYLFDDPVDDVLKEAVIAVSDALSLFDKKETANIARELADVFESICTVTKVRAFQEPEGFEAIVKIIENAFKSGDSEAVDAAAHVISTVLPQLSSPPVSTRALIASCVYAIQTFTEPETLLKVLTAARALFERAASERQMLPNSLPPSILRLFRVSDANLHAAAADALVSFANRVSTPGLIMRLMLQVVRSQPSGLMLNSLIKVFQKNVLSDDLAEECLNTLTTISTGKYAKLASQAIGQVLLSARIEYSVKRVLQQATSIIVIDQIMKSGKKELIEGIKQYVLSNLSTFENEELYASLVVSLILTDPKSISTLLPRVLSLAEGGSGAERAVNACQEIQRLSALKNWSGEKERVLKVLMKARRQGQPALKSAVATTIFDLFSLDEKGKNEIVDLAHKAESSYEEMDEMIQQVLSDRANLRIVRG